MNSTPPEMLEAFNAPPPSDPLVDSVRALLGPTPKWSGTATQLLKLLPLCQTPRALSAQLNKSILPLADAGIDIQFRRLPGGERVIDLFASQNLQPPPQPEPEKELIPTPQIPAPPALCVTTPVGQLGKLRAGCLPAQPAESVPSAAASKSSDTIETTPLIDTVPDILARIVAKKREDLAATVQPLEAWEREAELRLPARRDFRAALAAHAPAIIAEIKKASPSKGVLSARFRSAPHRARLRKRAELPPSPSSPIRPSSRAAWTISQAARAAVSLPVLRKDFTIDRRADRGSRRARRRRHPADRRHPHRRANPRLPRTRRDAIAWPRWSKFTTAASWMPPSKPARI